MTGLVAKLPRSLVWGWEKSELPLKALRWSKARRRPHRGMHKMPMSPVVEEVRSRGLAQAGPSMTDEEAG